MLKLVNPVTQQLRRTRRSACDIPPQLALDGGERNGSPRTKAKGPASTLVILFVRDGARVEVWHTLHLRNETIHCLHRRRR